MAKYTTLEIINQFIKTHGNRYDYSLVVYLHSQQKVKIICRTHGIFEQLAGAHRRGQGCAQCMYDEKRFTVNQVFKKFKDIHQDRYDYSLVNYVNIDSKIKIICSTHGVFEQTPWNHLQGNGCPKCIGRHKTKEEIIKAFTGVHGYKYDYSLVEYKFMMSKVKIICRVHGVFEQTPQKHIKGNGCARCSGTYLLTTEEIIEQFKNIHGSKYDYSLVDYVNIHSRVKIICPEHGVFRQTAGSHKAGNGCPKCAGNYNLNTIEVVKQFNAIHGERYDYSKVVYKNIFHKVQIICRDHGSFFQSAKSHRDGSGCPKCVITIDYTKDSYINLCKTYASGDSHLYVIQCFDENELFYKVGISYYGANRRFNSKGKMPYNFKILNEIKGNAELVWDLEKKIHKLLKQYRIAPIKAFHGSTECFREIPHKVKELIKNIEASKQLILAT